MLTSSLLTFFDSQLTKMSMMQLITELNSPMAEA